MTAKERPILFSAPMVQAILDGRKTMTRQVINRLTPRFGRITEFSESDTHGYDFCFRDREMRCHDMTRARVLEFCPYGKPGDRLWVKETWRYTNNENAIHYAAGNTVLPIASDPDIRTLFSSRYKGGETIKWKSPRFMPRWASRILLEVTEVRIERLQDVSHGDALSEGVLTYTDWMTPEYKAQCEAARITGTEPPLGYSPRQRFQHLWDSIKGHGAWDANPWVWVISFRRLDHGQE